MTWSPILAPKKTEDTWQPILPSTSKKGISLTTPSFGMAQSTQQQSTLNVNPLTILRDTGQAIARTVGSVGITAGNLANKSKPFPETVETSWSPITRAVFGGQPINTIQQSIKNTEKTTSPYLGKSGSNLLAPTFVLGSIALDLSGFGGGKAVKLATGEIPEAFFKTMAKETNPSVIDNILKTVGVDDASRKVLSPQFALTKTVEEAQDVLLQFGKNEASITASIAQSKDSAEIAKILQNTGVDKEQIPQMAKILVGIDNPKKVNTIIEGFDTARTPKKLPPELEEKAIQIELKKEQLDNSPFNHPDNRLMVDREGRIRELGDIKSPVLVRKIEDRMAEIGINDPAEFSAGVEDFFKQKQELKTLEAEIKKPVKYSAEGIPMSTKTIESKLTKQNFSESQKPIQKISGEPGEVKSIEIQAKQALDITNGVEIPSGVSLPKIISQTVTPVQKKVHILDTYLRTPDRVMQKIGFGENYKEIRKAMDGYWKELPKNVDKIKQWAKEVPKESNERIFKYLDGQAITLRPEEMKVATEIRAWLQQWADRLKLKSDNKISEYITHIFDKESQAEFDEELAKLIADKIPGSVYDPFTLKRLGARGYKQDTWAALDAYVKRGTRKVYMDPVLETIQSKAGSSLELSNIEKSQWKYIQQYINNINMRPSELDESIDNVVKSIVGNKFGNRPVTYLTKLLRQMTFRGMLGLNPGSALRNISQGINTYAVLGEKYTTIGYASLLKKGAMDELKEQGVLNAGFIQDKILSATGKAMEKVDKGLFFFFDTAEKINRGSAYFGAKSKALSNGKTEEQAIEYAKQIVRKTQFSFDSVDTPVGMQSDIMKTLFQFQSFTTKQIEFLGEMVKDKNFLGMIRYAVAGMVFVYTIGKAFGMEPKELLPIYRFDTPPSLKAPIEVVKAVADSPDKYGNDRDLGQKLSDIGKSVIGLIPAGTQVKKTVQGTGAMREGKATTKAGVAQFDVGGTTAKDIQAVVFGKYAGKNAKDYFDGDTYAEQKYNELLKSPTAKEDFEKIIAEDPSLAKNIIKIKEKIDLGITEDDEKLLKLNNQPRAEAIVKEFNKLKTKEEKAKLWEEYSAKKIITKDVAGKLIELLKKEQPVSAIKKGFNSLFGVRTASAAELPKEDMSVDRIKAEVAFRESGTSKTPYATVGITGDYGKYQVSPDTLKSYSKKFLGKLVTPQEFLKNPDLQEKFMEETIKHLRSKGAKSLDAFLILHHRGWGDVSSKRLRELKQSEEVKKYLNNKRK